MKPLLSSYSFRPKMAIVLVFLVIVVSMAMIYRHEQSGHLIALATGPIEENTPSKYHRLPLKVQNERSAISETRRKLRNHEPQTDRQKQRVAVFAEDLPFIYMVTPTYPRPVQIPELTRLAQTLRLVQNLHWIVVEDAAHETPAVVELLSWQQKEGLNSTHLLGERPEKFRSSDYKGSIPKGVSNRLVGMKWIKDHAQPGVMYFGDDDNTYDVRLFEEIRRTKKVSMFPVGLVTDTGLSTPVVKNGKVVDFYDGWIGGRTFPVDMAGFAVNVQFLKQHPEATMPFTPGYEEDGFLKSLHISKSDIEALAYNCTEILVWHTQTVKKGPFKKIDTVKYKDTNLAALSSQVIQRKS